MRDIKTFLAHLSHHPGVYQMLGAKGEVLYVGKAKDLKKRISSYFNSRVKDPKTLSLTQQIKNIDFTVTHNENEAVLLECNLIKRHRPRYNVLLRDDKSYPYILITNQHPYPRIDIYRGQRRKNGLYFGPYPSAGSVRETINLLQKIFRLRTCKDSYFDARTRPCLLYQIDRCTGPCVGLVSHVEYAQQVKLAILFLEGKSHEVIENLQAKMENSANNLDYEQAGFYRDQINRLRQIQDRQYVSMTEGNADVIGFAMQSGIACIQLLTIRGGQVLGSRSYFPSVPAYSHTDEILSAFLTQHYLNDVSHIESIPKMVIIDAVLTENALLESVLSEQAKHKVEMLKPVRGEKKKWLEMATLSAKQSLAAHMFNKANIKERALALKEALELEKTPNRIECFDISHSMGEATVASCVVFDQSGPIKSDYRRFNIRDVTPGDDVAAMRQAVLRRFKRLQQDHAALPDVVLIDGGPTQLSAAKQALAELELIQVLLVGVSKGPDRKAGFETLHREGKTPMHLMPDSIALHFIQQIRDEAHRFAITGHRNRRDKVRRESTLEAIPGIGAKRRRDLLRYFGGIQGIAHASLDELMKVSGISRSLAERILRHFTMRPYDQMFNWPNLLTIARISVIPLLVVFFYLPFSWGHTAATIVFTLASITDWLDGYLARYLKQSTKLGAFLDPVADKLMVSVALVLIVAEPTFQFVSVTSEVVSIPTCVITIPAAIIVAREIIVSALREWMAEVGKRTSVAVSSLGKIKTTVQMLALIVLLYCDNTTNAGIVLTGYALLYISAFLTIWSMLIYLKAAWAQLVLAD